VCNQSNNAVVRCLLIISIPLLDLAISIDFILNETFSTSILWCAPILGKGYQTRNKCYFYIMEGIKQETNVTQQFIAKHIFIWLSMLTFVA